MFWLQIATSNTALVCMNYIPNFVGHFFVKVPAISNHFVATQHFIYNCSEIQNDPVITTQKLCDEDNIVFWEEE